MRKTSKGKGYKSKSYSYAKALKHYKRTGKFKNRQGGSGHRAGEAWGSKKEIDPKSPIRRYSKNSPSFDEGVRQYKDKAKNRALNNMKHE